MLVYSTVFVRNVETSKFNIILIIVQEHVWIGWNWMLSLEASPILSSLTTKGRIKSTLMCLGVCCSMTARRCGQCKSGKVERSIIYLFNDVAIMASFEIKIC